MAKRVVQVVERGAAQRLGDEHGGGEVAAAIRGHAGDLERGKRQRYSRLPSLEEGASLRSVAGIDRSLLDEQGAPARLREAIVEGETLGERKCVAGDHTESARRRSAVHALTDDQAEQRPANRVGHR